MIDVNILVSFIVLTACFASATSQYMHETTECPTNLTVKDTYKSTSNCKSAQLGNIAFEMRESKFGILNLNISFPSVIDCDFDKFQILLYVNQYLRNEMDCKNKVFNNNDTVIHKYHTKHTFCNSLKGPCKKEDHIICVEDISVEFWFVFEGCYRVYIIHDKQSVVFESSSFWVKSTYVNKDVESYVPTVHDTPNLKLGTLTLSLTYDDPHFLLMDNKLYFEFTDGSERETCVGWYLGEYISTALIATENIVMTNISRPCPLYNYDNQEFPECRYYNNPHTIRCEYKPNSTKYVVSLVIHECDLRSILSGDNIDSCMWVLEKKTPDAITNPKDVIKRVPGIEIYQIVIPIVVMCFILMSSVTVYTKYCRSRYIARKRNIFLVYARDCESTMDVVSSFTKLLKDVGNFEIYDIYNTHYFDEICQRGVEWVSTKIRKSDFVLFIATKCGEEFYEQNINTLDQYSNINFNLNLLNQSCVYRKPECFDNLFLYAYKLGSIANRFYIIQFPDLLKNINRSVINPKKRLTFKIPKNFRNLCIQLRIYKRNALHEENLNYINMMHCIATAKDFMVQHPDYLMESLLLYRGNVN